MTTVPMVSAVATNASGCSRTRANTLRGARIRFDAHWPHTGKHDPFLWVTWHHSVPNMRQTPTGIGRAMQLRGWVTRNAGP